MSRMNAGPSAASGEGARDLAQPARIAEANDGGHPVGFDCAHDIGTAAGAHRKNPSMPLTTSTSAKSAVIPRTTFRPAPALN